MWHRKAIEILGQRRPPGNVGHAFFTPRTFFERFLRSFICLRDFWTFEARPTWRQQKMQHT